MPKLICKLFNRHDLGAPLLLQVSDGMWQRGLGLILYKQICRDCGYTHKTLMTVKRGLPK